MEIGETEQVILKHNATTRNTEAIEIEVLLVVKENPKIGVRILVVMYPFFKSSLQENDGDFISRVDFSN